MTKPAHKTQKVRLQLELSVKTKARLERVQEALGAGSMTEAVRRSLTLCEAVIAIQNGGGEVFFRGKDGTEIVFRFLP